MIKSQKKDPTSSCPASSLIHNQIFPLSYPFVFKSCLIYLLPAKGSFNRSILTCPVLIPSYPLKCWVQVPLCPLKCWVRNMAFLVVNDFSQQQLGWVLVGMAFRRPGGHNTCCCFSVFTAFDRLVVFKPSPPHCAYWPGSSTLVLQGKTCLIIWQ